jgi:hypothetical protein
MAACRSTLIASLLIGAGAQSNVAIPVDAVSLVVYNPSLANVYLRWSGDPVAIDAGRTGYDLPIPGESLMAIPIPATADFLSLDWSTSSIPEDPGSPPIAGLDTDTVLVYTTPNNQGTFVGPLAGTH